MPQHQVRNNLQILQIIRWIGKNHIILLFADGYKPENIHAHGMDPGHTYLPGYSGNEHDRPAVAVHQINFPATSR